MHIYYLAFIIIIKEFICIWKLNQQWIKATFGTRFQAFHRLIQWQLLYYHDLIRQVETTDWNSDICFKNKYTSDILPRLPGIVKHLLNLSVWGRHDGILHVIHGAPYVIWILRIDTWCKFLKHWSLGIWIFASLCLFNLFTIIWSLIVIQNSKLDVVISKIKFNENVPI